MTALTWRSPSPSGVELNISRPGTPSVSPVRWQPRQRNSRLNYRPLRRPLLQRVEDQAGAGVVGGDLEQVAVAHPAERDAVVEEERPRVRRADQPGLQAAFREQQQLRVDRQLQRVEHRRQVAGPPLEGQPRRPVGQAPVQVVHDVADRRGGIGNRGVVGRTQEHPAALGAERRRGHGQIAAPTMRGAESAAPRPAEGQPPPARKSSRRESRERPDPACRRVRFVKPRQPPAPTRLAAATACAILRRMPA